MQPSYSYRKALLLLSIVGILALSFQISPKIIQASSNVDRPVRAVNDCFSEFPEQLSVSFARDQRRELISDCELQQPAPKDWYPSNINRLYGPDTTSGTGLGSAFAYDHSSNTLAVAASNRDSARGAVYIFTLNGDQWIQQAILTASDGAPGDMLGYKPGTLAMQGNTLVVGAPFHNNRMGAVYVFVRNANQWIQTAKLNGTAVGGHFGYSVSFYANTIAVGAPYEQVYAGAAYVYTGSIYNWTLQARFVSDTPRINGYGAYYGISIAVEGITLVVGGATYQPAQVYKRSNGIWTLAARLLPDIGFWTTYGTHVAINNCDIAVGAISRAVYIFSNTSCESWIQSATFQPSNNISGFAYYMYQDGPYLYIGYLPQYEFQVFVCAFSASTCSSGNRFPGVQTWATIGYSRQGIVLGFPGSNVGNGSFHTYEWPNQWEFIDHEWKASNPQSYSHFGKALSVSGNTALVGAPDQANGAGSAYIYTFSNGAWSFQAKLTPTNPELYSVFGNAVSISGDLAAVTAQQNNQGVDTVFIFQRTGTTWVQQAELANALCCEIAGSINVSISGDALAVQTPSGDTFFHFIMFDRDNTTWVRTQILDAYTVYPGQIDLDGDTFVISPGGYDPALVYRRVAGVWNREATLSIDDGSGLQFGDAVDLSGDRIIMNAVNQIFYPKAAYIFKRDGVSWSIEQKLTSIDDVNFPVNSPFADSVAISGNHALLTRPYQSRAYLYVLNKGIWEQQRVFDAPFLSNFTYRTMINGQSVLSDSGQALVGGIYGAGERGEVITFDTLQTGARRDTIGIYRQSNNTFYLKQSNTTGFADYAVQFGYACGGNTACNYPVVGDWDGDGIDTIGIYDRTTGVFQLRNTNTPGAADITLTLGNPGDTPLAGRWANDMTGDGVGVFRPTNGILYLKKTLTTGFSDYYAVMGNPNDIGIAGDWDGDMVDNVGIYRPDEARFYLSYTNGPAGITYADNAVLLGNVGDAPVVGDWEGLGHSGLGVFRPTTGEIYMKNFVSSGFADKYLIFGDPADIPIAGRWTAPLAPPMSRPNILVNGITPSTNIQSGNAD